MTKARRRIVRLALMLKVAGVELPFVGNYREIRADMELQWSGLAPSRRKSARRQAQRLIVEAGSLGNAADHLVPSALQLGSGGRELPIESSPDQVPQRPPERPRCGVCQSRFGKQKRSFPSEGAAQRFCAEQRDPGLVVYACPAGIGGHHLGHRPSTRPATVGNPVTAPQGRESHRNQAYEAPMLPTSQHNKSPLIRAELANPWLILCYSTALLLVGSGLGRWVHTPATALRLCIAGGVTMACHDLCTGILWTVWAGRWARFVMSQRK